MVRMQVAVREPVWIGDDVRMVVIGKDADCCLVMVTAQQCADGEEPRSNTVKSDCDSHGNVVGVLWLAAGETFWVKGMTVRIERQPPVAGATVLRSFVLEIDSPGRSVRRGDSAQQRHSAADSEA